MDLFILLIMQRTFFFLKPFYFFLIKGIGILKNVQGKKSNIGDQIPVDYVVDFILVVGAYTANDKSFSVFFFLED